VAYRCPRELLVARGVRAPRRRRVSIESVDRAARNVSGGRYASDVRLPPDGLSTKVVSMPASGTSWRGMERRACRTAMLCSATVGTAVTRISSRSLRHSSLAVPTRARRDPDHRSVRSGGSRAAPLKPVPRSDRPTRHQPGTSPKRRVAGATDRPPTQRLLARRRPTAGDVGSDRPTGAGAAAWAALATIVDGLGPVTLLRLAQRIRPDDGEISRPGAPLLDRFNRQERAHHSYAKYVFPAVEATCPPTLTKRQPASVRR
jgi:hypothetical protein